MANFPRYLTFKAGELEQTLEGMGIAPATAASLRASGPGRKVLLVKHTCAVLYPDGTTGVCNYTRCAATWRVFRYEHLGADGKATHLPAQHMSERLQDTTGAVTAAAERLALLAFKEAVARERDFFRRANPLSGVRPSEKPQMKVKRAAELAGKYALCQPIGENLLPVSATFDTLEDAGSAWELQANHCLVVACCCRFRRRWERPRYNALHAREDYPSLVSSAIAPAVSSPRDTPSDLAAPIAIDPVDEDFGEDEELSPVPGSDFAPESEDE